MGFYQIGVHRPVSCSSTYQKAKLEIMGYDEEDCVWCGSCILSAATADNIICCGVCFGLLGKKRLSNRCAGTLRPQLLKQTFTLNFLSGQRSGDKFALPKCDLCDKSSFQIVELPLCAKEKREAIAGYRTSIIPPARLEICKSGCVLKPLHSKGYLGLLDQIKSDCSLTQGTECCFRCYAFYPDTKHLCEISDRSSAKACVACVDKIMFACFNDMPNKFMKYMAITDIFQKLGIEETNDSALYTIKTCQYAVVMGTKL